MWLNVSSKFAENLRESSRSFAPAFYAHEDKVGALETIVRQALRAQRDWSDAATDRVVSVPGMPDGVAELARQAKTVADGMLEFQSQFWDGWFRIVRNAGDSAVTAVPVTEEPAAIQTVEPAPIASAPVEEVEAALEETAPAVEDDLRAISGIGPVLAGKLQSEGITSYRQILGWSDEDIASVEAAIIPARFHGRIRRDDWIGQAKELHFAKYGERL